MLEEKIKENKMGRMAELAREIENQYDGSEGIDLKKAMGIKKECEFELEQEAHERKIHEKEFEDFLKKEKK